MTGTLVNRLNGLIPRREDLLAPFESHFNKLFDEFFNEGSLSSVKGRAGYPKIDVISEKDKWIVEVAAPGVKAEDIEVEIMPHGEEKFLRIAGKMSEDRQYSTEAKYHVKELRRSAFERTLLIPTHVEGEPEAVMKDGILTLSWKIPEATPTERKLVQIKQE